MPYTQLHSHHIICPHHYQVELPSKGVTLNPNFLKAPKAKWSNVKTWGALKPYAAASGTDGSKADVWCERINSTDDVVKIFIDFDDNAYETLKEAEERGEELIDWAKTAMAEADRQGGG